MASATARQRTKIALGVLMGMFFFMAVAGFALKLAIISNAVVAAAIASMSFLTFYLFLPHRAKKFVMLLPVAWTLDLVISMGVAQWLQGTITGAIAGISTGLLISFIIECERLRLFPAKK